MNHNYYLLQYYRVTDTLELQLNPTFLGQAQQLKLVCTYNLGVSPSLVSKWREAYSFGSI